jgi:hypothetical protein
MLVEFLACPGYTEDLFWSLTPRQIETHFAAARKRYIAERNMMMETSYLAAIVPHAKKPTELKDLLLQADEKPRQKQTPEQRLAAAGMWAAAMSTR